MMFARVLTPALCLSTLTGVFFSSSAIAASSLELGYDTPAFSDRTLQAGPVRVSVDYTPKSPGGGDGDNLFYEIYVNDRRVVSDGAEVWMWGEVNLRDLDADGVPEVVLNTYTGGAHCCNIHTIYSWRGNEILRTITYPLDGGGGHFEDLDGDGTQEFITFDNAFLYAFSSYAGSFPPLIILSFQEGQWVDVTRQYPERQRSHAWQAYLRIRDGDTYEVNGALAGYVAQKILLGEYRQGWELMQVHYDRADEWGLDIYDDGDVVGRYPDYPSALRAFLIQRGYLTADGRPNLQLDLRDRVVAETRSLPTSR